MVGVSPGNKDDNRCCRRYAALFYADTEAINVVAPLGLKPLIRMNRGAK